MPVPTLITDLSTTAGSNSPAGTETPTDGDNYIRVLSAFLASIRDNTGNGWTSPYATPASVAAAIAALPTLSHGTYTPTPTNMSNVASFTARVCQWMRVGNTVGVSGAITLTPTSAVTTTFRLSIPVASALVNQEQAGGSGVSRSPTGAKIACAIYAETTNDALEFSFTADSNAAQTIGFSAIYLVL